MLVREYNSSEFLACAARMERVVSSEFPYSDIMYLYVFLAIGFTCAHTMDDMNSPINDAPAEHAPAIAPLTKTNDQMLPSREWILWGVIHRSNVDYAERIWEEFAQSIQTFLTDKNNLTTAARGKKKSTLLLIPSIRLTKLVIHYLKIKHNFHPRTNLPVHYTHEDFALGILRPVGKDGRETFERGKAEEGGVTKSPKATKVTKPKAAKQTKPSRPKAPKHTSSQPLTSTPTPTEPSKIDQEKEPAYNDEEVNLQQALELSLKEQEKQGPTRPMVIREPDSGRIQPLPDVQGKGKEKVRIAMPTEPSGHAESPSLDEELALTNSESESNKGVPEINAGDNNEDQARPNPDQVILKDPTRSTRTLSSLQNLDKELSFTNQFLVEKLQEEKPKKTNTEFEVQSLVTVPIHQDTSLVLPMSTSVIDLIVLQPVSVTVQASLPTSITITSAVTKKRKRRDLSRTHSGSPPPQPPPPPPPVGASRASDTKNDHLPNADTKKDWWKPLSKEERPATPEPAWTIPSFNVSDPKNNWAYALVSTYKPPAENSFLAKIGDMTTFVNWYCRKVNKTVLTQADFEGHAYEVVIGFYLEYGNKESSHALSISKMKAARYPNFDLELLVPKQMWIDDVHDSPSRRKEVKTHMRIFSVVRIKAYLRYVYDYLSEIVLRRANFQEHTIAKKDFKNLYPSDFEELNLLLLQGWDAKGYEFKDGYTIIESPRAVVFLVNNNKRKIMRFNKIYKFSDGTLTRILEALDYRSKEFKVKRLNSGMNTRFWTQKDVTRSKEFIAAIERRLKTRRIYWNLECFVGGRVRDIDYKLL
uniref:Uncharacterized protein n=1 Tax=Tanacetum cinerariifolium TaxID=118510 RepID=A0A6L2J660_TANCI|nr:hypothetical protein [Tanacetum cinerariifolium]